VWLAGFSTLALAEVLVWCCYFICFLFKKPLICVGLVFKSTQVLAACDASLRQIMKKLRTNKTLYSLLFSLSVGAFKNFT